MRAGLAAWVAGMPAAAPKTMLVVDRTDAVRATHGIASGPQR